MSRLARIAGFALLAGLALWLTPAANGYDGPLRLARELLRGRTYLPEFVPWLEMFRHDARDYIAYPPMVSFVLLPYAALGGAAAGQPLANTLAILASAWLLARLLRACSPLAPLAPLAAVAYLVGTPNLYSAHHGDVWLLMHSEGNLFLLLALVLLVERRRPFWAGLAFAVAMQVRYVLALAAPAFLLLMMQEAPAGSRLGAAAARLSLFAAGALPPLLCCLAYQWATLGDPWLTPYQAGWREWGLHGPVLSPAYLPQNLWVYTLAHPSPAPYPPFLRFEKTGQSPFVMSPFLLGLFAARADLPFVRALLPSLAAMAGFYLLYFGTGYAQLGARYMQDLFPLLLPVALSAFSRPHPLWRRALGWLLGAAVLMNALALWATSRAGG